MTTTETNLRVYRGRDSFGCLTHRRVVLLTYIILNTGSVGNGSMCLESRNLSTSNQRLTFRSPPPLCQNRVRGGRRIEISSLYSIKIYLNHSSKASSFSPFPPLHQMLTSIKHSHSVIQYMLTPELQYSLGKISPPTSLLSIYLLLPLPYSLLTSIKTSHTFIFVSSVVHSIKAPFSESTPFLLPKRNCS
jgi:hypothetical protein